MQMHLHLSYSNAQPLQPETSVSCIDGDPNQLAPHNSTLGSHLMLLAFISLAMAAQCCRIWLADVQPVKSILLGHALALQTTCGASLWRASSCRTALSELP